MKSRVDKNRVIDILEEIAVLLELREANVFKIRAFQNAARVLEGCPSDLPHLVDSGELETLKGIGKGHIAQIIRDLYATGRSKDHEELQKGLPATLFEMLKIPGLGAKRIKILYDKLKIGSVAELKAACEAGRLSSLEGFGQKTQDKILQGIGHLDKSAGQYRVHEAGREADKLLAWLKKTEGLQKIELAGSLRRHKEIVKDIDILASAGDPAKVHAAFLKYPGVRTVVAQGETKSSVTLRSGINCDLRTVKEAEFPYALYYFTGSKEHNVAVRTLAKKKNIKINEYGLFKGTKLIRCKDEAEIFKAVGLHYVPPEVRENTGEIEWAAKQPFPDLVAQPDLRGVFHVHSTYSDGVGTLEQMVKTAEKMGLDYVGISDHSQSAAYAGGMKIERVKQQWKEIDALQKRVKIRIFKGIESDILADGSLDYPDSILAGFDFVIGSVHSRFTLPEKEQTDRMLRAMESKYLTFIGHPTGRLLLKRAGYKLDMDRFLDGAAESGVSVELNADPHRLDLDWRLCQTAKKKGIRFGIHPDAHSVEGMANVRYGIGMARKGWLEKRDVVNTLGVSEIEKFLKRRR